MVKWRCSVCGYGYTDNESPSPCPVCGADGSRFVSAEGDDDGAPSQDSPAPNTMIPASRRWPCGVCGYIHSGPEPPEACPVCGAQRAKFAPLEETLQTVAPAAPEPRSVDPSAIRPATSQWQAVAASIAPHRRWIDLSIDHHAHPIAVHIPNGVLSITALMVFSAAVFDWPVIGQAAIYNLGFICLAMPLVLFTGFVHWQFKFGGHMTDLFKWMLICGATVLLVSLIIFVWSLFSPESARNPGSLYLLLHVILLAVAGVAGWLGGKLVFRPRG